jgi:hypothetical protein
MALSVAVAFDTPPNCASCDADDELVSVKISPVS